MVTILVAEDDRSTNMLVRAVLRRAGYESLSARDGAEARNVIGAHHVDLVVCDVMMPNVDGLELLRWLRAEGNDVPVLMLTARAGQGDKNAGLAEGDTQSSESTVNVHVNRLRTRFAGWDDFKIETVRGIGYRGVVREEG